MVKYRSYEKTVKKLNDLKEGYIDLIKELKTRQVPENIKSFIEETKKGHDSFFEITFSKDLELILLKSRREMDLLSFRQTPDWIFALTTSKDRLIRIFDPEYVEESTNNCHKKEEFPKTLAHELSHVYFYEVTKVNFPKFLNEGLAYVVADQRKSKKGIEDLVVVLDSFYVFNPDHYARSAKLVELFLNTFGKDKLISLLKSGYTDEDTFKANFKVIYGFDFNKQAIVSAFKSI